MIIFLLILIVIILLLTVEGAVELIGILLLIALGVAVLGGLLLAAVALWMHDSEVFLILLGIVSFTSAIVFLANKFNGNNQQ